MSLFSPNKIINSESSFKKADIDNITKKHPNMIPVVMESRMKHTSTWTGVLGMALGSTLYVDFSGDRQQNLNSFHILEKEIAARLNI